MVFYKRKPVQLETLKDVDLRSTPGRAVWQIPETQEVYLNYEDFLQRKAFYDSRLFTCEVTGRTNLTYKQAFSSEVAEAKDLEESFPESLKEPVLRKAHGSTVSRLDGLVELVYESFKSEYFPGEYIVALVDGYKQSAQVREKTKLVEMTFPDGFHRPASARYVIELEEADEDVQSERLTVDESTISRERGVFSKIILRFFLRSAVRRDPKVGSPWQVKPEFAARYRIAPLESKEMPTKLERADSPTRTCDKEAQGHEPAQDIAIAIKDLVEDLNLPSRKRKRPRLERESPVRPELVQNLLEVWAYFNVFLEVLTLDSFTLDDFGDALQSTERSELIDELVCSVLKMLNDDKTQPYKVIEAEEAGEPDLKGAVEVVEPDARTKAVLQIVPEWKSQLASQDYENGRYVQIVLGILGESSRSGLLSSAQDVVLDIFLNGHKRGGEELPKTLRMLSADNKLHLLMLMTDLTWQTDTVRQYIDECMDNQTVLRKDRADATKVRKGWTDAIHQLRLKMRSQFPRLAVATGTREEQLRQGALEDNGSSRPGSSDAESEGEDESTNGHDGRRRTSYRLVNKLASELDVDSHDEANNGDSTGTFKSRDDFEWEIQKIRKLVTKADHRIRRIEEEFRESDAQRLRMLGQDRYWNTYWFLESCGMPVYGLPNCSTSHAGFATGRIFVQGPTLAAAAELQHRSEVHEFNYLKRRQEEEGESVMGPDMWGYYDDEEQVKDLLEWLDARGIRESKLKAAIEQRSKTIVHGMQHRTRYLTGEIVGERRSSRKTASEDETPRFQRWRNTMARKTLGAPHSGEVKVKGVALVKKRKL